ncbi:MATE family efflux transporter [Sellimonas intestinalis]|uniref:MATE family efflux transporter n=1 Tax=Sellimonas intestinalis TaxID=1653434 RepID=UPI0039936DFE
MENNMTTGNPGKLIVRFTLPVFIGNVFQQFYSMVDAVIVGKFVGTKALAGVGATGTINFLIIGFLLGLTAGFTVLTAQKYGAGDLGAMRKTVASAAILSLVVSVVMTAASVIFMKNLLRLMNTPEDIFDYAYEYIVIICAGIFAQVLYNLLSSVLRALGNSRTPLYFLILAALLNVALDLVFIVCFHMGPAGAAYATVIAQGISGAACLLYIWKAVPQLHLHKGDWKVEGSLLKTQMRIGFPMALQYSITAIGTMMVQSALNLLGSISVAAFTAASKIEQIVTQAYVALGTAMATYCAQNMGAGDVQRIRHGFRSATILGSVYSVVAAVLMVSVGHYLTYLFVEAADVPKVIGEVRTYLICVSVFFIPLTVVNLYRNGIQGMGYGFLPMTAGIAELVGRGVVAVIASWQRSYVGVCLASPMAWVLAGALLLWMYFRIMRNLDQNPSA